MIPIYEPYLGKEEKENLYSAYNSGWISSQGKFIQKFEKAIAKFHNVKYCVAVSSCTTAIHLSILSLGIGKGDEIICPSLTFIAPANMIALSGAKLVLVDIDKDTLTIDYQKIEKKINSRTKAILVVHQFGHSAHMDEILKIANKNNLKIIEDNAESLGGKYKDKILGSIGDIGTLSFFANKIITTGEGGALITNNKRIADKARILRDHGMSKVKKYHFIYQGFNYRMTNMQAAIGYAQITKLNKILKIRNKQMLLYYKILSKNEKIILRKFSDWTSPVHWLMTLSIKSETNSKKIIEYMKNKGIECRPMISPVSDAEHFKDKINYKDSAVAKKISTSFFHLPSSTKLKEEEIVKVCQEINNFIDRRKI